jgi:hypothetical protein
MTACKKDRVQARRGAIVVASALALLLMGCSHLLPAGSVAVGASFPSFEAAQRAFERIVPYRTSVEELVSLGFDPAGSLNVTLIPYPDLVGRLAPNASVAFSELDPGIRDCILARMACRAYEFRIAHEARRRTGSFMLDFLNFRRTTVVTGWRFEGMVAVRDGVVLFRTFGGAPSADRTEQQVNPLGPLQSGGEAIAGRLAQ